MRLLVQYALAALAGALLFIFAAGSAVPTDRAAEPWVRPAGALAGAVCGVILFSVYLRVIKSL